MCSQTRSRASETRSSAVLRCCVVLLSFDACAAKRAAERTIAEALLCRVALLLCSRPTPVLRNCYYASLLCCFAMLCCSAALLSLDVSAVKRAAERVRAKASLCCDALLICSRSTLVQLNGQQSEREQRLCSVALRSLDACAATR